ncbi:MAG: hypothetical protein RI973_690 [Bacteroidota bacterium]|jgi:L-amino acid N-acyltransferase YncA
MIYISTAETMADLEGILQLQQANLVQNLPADEVQSQGFLIAMHTLEILKRQNDIERHVVARDGGPVVAYLLAMTKASKHDLPVLVAMFDEFDSLLFKGRPVAQYNYMVVGQACVDKRYRGSGILDDCYRTYRGLYSGRYDFAITEIAGANHRSLRAHQRIGFEEIHAYVDPRGTEWRICCWDWKKKVP